jgi:hypothetical protein
MSKLLDVFFKVLEGEVTFPPCMIKEGIGLDDIRDERPHSFR